MHSTPLNLRRLGALYGAALTLLLAGVLTSCSTSTPDGMQARQFNETSFPTQLSEWQLLRHSNGQLQRADNTLVYTLNTPLFADYTSKLRTITVPEGAQASYRDVDALEFPVGTVISKTFYYDTQDVPLSAAAQLRPALFAPDQTRSGSTEHKRLLETRLLVRTQTGWHALPYVWNDAQTDAVLSVTGAIKDIGDNLYIVPSKDECASCHAVGQDKVIHPIGPKARHLHQASGQAQSALQALSDRGWLDTTGVDMAAISGNAVWKPNLDLTTLSNNELNHRARSYLDANCGHCHNPKGSADTSHLYLDYANHSNRTLGECKPPVAAGRGTGGNLYSIVPGSPTTSIMSYRMRSTDPGRMMPETGRTRVHEEGADLIDEWIRRQPGVCL